MMARILNNAQCQELEHLMQELNAYRATGLTPEQVQAMIDREHEAAPKPIDLWHEDISLGRGLLEDDHDPAREAAEQYDETRWDK